MTNTEIQRVIGSSAVRVFSDPGFLTRAAGDEGTYDRVHDISGQYFGSDAFTGPCLVDADAVEVTDASQARTRLSVDTGKPL